jgi:UDP-N-acetyl-D-glucosamine dehydrogenase
LDTSSLLERIESRQATIAVIGMGYVGLPLALRFSAAGFPTLGIESHPGRAARLAEGNSLFQHVCGALVLEALARGTEFTGELARIAEADVVILCLPTPLNEHREPDLSHVLGTLEAMLPALQPGCLVVLESTTYPGTTEEELKPRLEAAGFDVGKNVFLVYSPERADPGNPEYDIENIPKLVSGCSQACLALGMALYSSIVEEVVPVSSARVAELSKLLENIHRAVNIGLINEMKIIADRMGINIYEVIEAASTKPFGFVPYYPGPGLGGHCIPIDPFYLVWKAREYDVHSRFIELAGEVNSSMPGWVVGKIAGALNERGRAVKGSRILLLGIGYKKNLDDIRESSSIEIMHRLRDLGAEVVWNDPYFDTWPQDSEAGVVYEWRQLSPEELMRADGVVIGADHDVFDYELIRQHARLIVDTRGRYRQPEHHVVMA